MDVLLNILTYALPPAFAVQLLNWLRNRRLSKARNGGDIDAAYLDNINLLREELIKIQDENRKLYKVVARLDRTVARATACRHWNNCPIRNELQKSGTDRDSLPASKRQPAKRKTIRSDPPARGSERSADDLTDEPAGCIAEGGGI